VGNPAEETYCHPNDSILLFCNFLSISYHARPQPLGFASLGLASANFIVRLAGNGWHSRPETQKLKDFPNPEIPKEIASVPESGFGFLNFGFMARRFFQATLKCLTRRATRNTFPLQ